MVVLTVAYTICLVATVLYLFLRMTGRIEIRSQGGGPRLRPGMLILPNHPDVWDCMAEVFLVPAVFWPQVLLNPIKFMPWFTPDGRNFTDKWYWAWLRPRAIPIRRFRSPGTNGRKEAKNIIGVLNEFKGVIVHFAGGGRDCTYAGELLQSTKGKKMRPLNPIVGRIWAKTKSAILPIWIDNGDFSQQPGKPLFSRPNFKRGKVVITIGRPIEFSEKMGNKGALELTRIISENLLALADKE